MMMELMYAFLIAFFVLNTISFYVMDYVTDRLLIEKTDQLTPQELSFYVFLRILTSVSIVGIAITVIYNLCMNIMGAF